MKKALIIVDYVYDFVAEDGKLTCGKPGQDIEGNIVGLIEEFKKEGSFVVVARDNHWEEDVYNKERDMFPAHCTDEKGRGLYGKVSQAVLTVPKNQYLEIEKNHYSSFYGTPLDLKLKEREVKEVHIVGVCTDICVLHAAIDAYNLGYKIVIHRGSVASFNEEGHKWALSHIENVLCGEVVD